VNIRFEEELGFAQVTRRTEIDADSLPSHLQDQIQVLLDHHGRGALAAKKADIRITIEDGAGQTTLEMRRWQVPKAARDLVAFLRNHATPAEIDSRTNPGGIEISYTPGTDRSYKGNKKAGDE
jgi:hypothetical protein